MRSYEGNEEKLEKLRSEMENALDALQQLNSKPISPLKLRAWSAQKMVCVTLPFLLFSYYHC